MIEIYGQLFSQKADVICITTNGSVNKHGNAVMGRGCALKAKNIWPGIQTTLGGRLKHRGNHVFQLTQEDLNQRITMPDAYVTDIPWHIYSFPVKHQWNLDADLNLIKRSAYELLEFVNTCKYENVIIPRMGCGYGKLDWESQVKPMVNEILDDRFSIITW